ncbi:MAG: hypothetical protein K1X67_11620 [Fimbriimonadaceae bacterium]|nr:hypothetical protein [Fimbriimonadaceae bacterium]
MVENILAIAGPIGGLVAVVAVVLALIGHLYGRQVSIGRETVRKLRVGLEHDPSPGQLGQALRLWPEAAKYPGNNQRIELVKQANLDEARRANQFEFVKGVVRMCIGIAFLGVVLYILSMIFKPGKAVEPEPKPQVRLSISRSA